MAKNNKNKKIDPNEKITNYFIDDIERITLQLAKEEEISANLKKKLKNQKKTKIFYIIKQKTFKLNQQKKKKKMK